MPEPSHDLQNHEGQPVPEASFKLRRGADWANPQHR